MRSTYLFTGILLFGASPALAQWYPSPAVTQSAAIEQQPLRCPTVGKDHSQMISSLYALQDQIKKDANCTALTTELQKIGELGNTRREKFLALVEKARAGSTLTDTENKEMTDYVEAVTVKAASLATLLSGSAQCFGEQDTSTSLFAVSSFVNEATTLLSTIAGPWGPALSIGGRVVSGLIQGVNKFIQSLPGYDFNDKKDWQGYVETLCMFHEQQDEIAALIHPDEAIQKLVYLNSKAEMQLNAILSGNPEGTKLLHSFEAQNDSDVKMSTELMNNYGSGLDGVKALRLLTAQSWIQKRITSIRKDAKDPMISSTGQHLIQKMRDEIEDFLITRQGPKFLHFQNNDSSDAVAGLNSLITRSGYPIYGNILQYNRDLIVGNTNNFGLAEPNFVMKTLMSIDEKQFINADTAEAAQIYDSLVYFRRSVNKQWDALVLSYGVQKSFCDFFKKAGYYGPDIRGACTSRTAKYVEVSIKKFVADGINQRVPSYLDSTLTPFSGLTWTDSLEAWLNLQ